MLHELSGALASTSHCPGPQSRATLTCEYFDANGGRSAYQPPLVCACACPATTSAAATLRVAISRFIAIPSLGTLVGARSTSSGGFSLAILSVALENHDVREVSDQEARATHA